MDGKTEKPSLGTARPRPRARKRFVFFLLLLMETGQCVLPELPPSIPYLTVTDSGGEVRIYNNKTTIYVPRSYEGLTVG